MEKSSDSQLIQRFCQPYPFSIYTIPLRNLGDPRPGLQALPSKFFEIHSRQSENFHIFGPRIPWNMDFYRLEPKLFTEITNLPTWKWNKVHWCYHSVLSPLKKSMQFFSKIDYFCKKCRKYHMAFSGFDKRLTYLLSWSLIMIQWCINSLKIIKVGVQLASGAGFLGILAQCA